MIASLSSLYTLSPAASDHTLRWIKQSLHERDCRHIVISKERKGDSESSGPPPRGRLPPPRLEENPLSWKGNSPSPRISLSYALDAIGHSQPATRFVSCPFLFILFQEEFPDPGTEVPLLSFYFLISYSPSLFSDVGVELLLN